MSVTHLAPRAGLTVVEVLVALVILTVGLLGMAGSAALSMRAAGRAAKERRALALVSSRMTLLLAEGCGRALSGETPADAAGIRLRWTVGTVARAVALVDATADWQDGAGGRSITLRGALLC